MIHIITNNVGLGQELTKWLQERDYDISFSQDGAEGLRLALEGSPSVVVVDLYLQNPNGLSLLHQLRGQGYRGKIILLAGLSVSTEVPQALHCGVEQIIGYPIALGQVECAIRAAMGLSSMKKKEGEEAESQRPACMNKLCLVL